MAGLPHNYTVSAAGTPDSLLDVTTNGIPNLKAAPPANFGGPGDQWSPEDLLTAALSTCLVLSFKAIARMSKLEWVNIECDTTGTLDKADGKMQFTAVKHQVKLTLPAGSDVAKAEKLLRKAEETCLISNSLTASSALEFEITKA